MTIGSVSFIYIFLPALLILYYLFSFSRVIQNVLLLVASIFFYSMNQPLYVIPLLMIISLNYFLGIIIGEKPLWQNGKKLQLVVFLITIVINVGTLFAARYLGFFAQVVNSVVGQELLPKFNWSAPLGIAVLVLHAIAYQTSLYLGESKAATDPIKFGLYLCFFPQLFAGPLSEYDYFNNQLCERKFNKELLLEGGYRLGQGIIKKILIADTLGVATDMIFVMSSDESHLIQVPVLLAWLGAILGTLRVYFYYVSISDIAIGLSGLFGIKLKENFNSPFMASSFTGFVERTNMTVNSWFKKHISAIPNKNLQNNDKTMLWDLIVCVLIALWYGAGWNYFWLGIVAFIVILLEKITSFETLINNGVIKRIYTVLLITFAMVFFNSNDGLHIVTNISNMLGLSKNGLWSPMFVMLLREYWPSILLAIFFILPTDSLYETCLGKLGSSENKNVKNAGLALRCILGVLFICAFIGLLLISFARLINVGSPFRV